MTIPYEKAVQLLKENLKQYPNDTAIDDFLYLSFHGKAQNLTLDIIDACDQPGDASKILKSVLKKHFLPLLSDSDVEDLLKNRKK